jgi:hypothetical protein
MKPAGGESARRASRDRVRSRADKPGTMLPTTWREHKPSTSDRLWFPAEPSRAARQLHTQSNELALLRRHGQNGRDTSARPWLEIGTHAEKDRTTRLGIPNPSDKQRAPSPRVGQYQRAGTRRSEHCGYRTARFCDPTRLQSREVPEVRLAVDPDVRQDWMRII